MEEIEKIPLKVAIDICKAFVQDPSNETYITALQDLREKLIIRRYLPIQEKITALYRAIQEADRPYDSASALFTAGMELAMTFNGLLAYTNISTIGLMDDKTYEAYDVLHQSGLIDYILRYCNLDYQRLCGMMERTISYENVRELIATLENIDTTSINASMAEFKQFRETATPNMIKDLADIVRFNDPNLYTVKNDLIDDALSKLETADKKEKLESEFVAEEE